MIENMYEIWCGNTMLADNMSIDIATIIVKALFKEWLEFGLELKIKRTDK